MISLRVWFVCALVLTACVSIAMAQGVPTTFTYQGKVTDASGQPLPDGSNAMQFKLFNVESGGAPLWDSGAMNVGVKGGVFSVVLGASPTPAITSSTLSSDSIWLEVKVGTDSPLPRTKLSSSPFALRAADLSLPFSKTVSSASAPAFEVKNTGANYAIKGESSSPSFAGLAGVNTAGGQGVYGSTASGSAVYGYNSGAGNVGFLASSTIGAYGSAGGTGHGVHGTNSGIGPGVVGLNTGTGYAGYFSVENAASPSPSLYAGHMGSGPAAHFDGEVGIGLSNPNRPLYVAQNAAGLVYPLKVDNPHSTFGTDAVGILFSTGGDGGGNLNVSRGKGALVYDYTSTWNRGKFHFLQEPSANDSNPTLANAVMTIQNDGRVGIGTSSPRLRLDVAGSGRIRGTGWPSDGKGMELAYDAGQNKGYVQVYDRDTSMWGNLYLGGGNVGIGTAYPTDRLHLFGQDSFVKVDGGASGLSGFRVHEDGNARWTMLFRQYQSDNLIFYDEVSANDTFVLESNANTARVNGDFVVTGAVRGTLGPNNGAPFPRPAFDSGWLPIAKSEIKTITHSVGVDVNKYVVSVDQRSDIGSVGLHNLSNGNLCQWYNLTTTQITVRRLEDDFYTNHVRVRIWLTN